MLGDQPLLSISNYPHEDNVDDFHNIPQCSPSISVAEDSNPQSLSQWLHSSTSSKLETSNVSEQQFEETNLEKELLSQQCGDLQEELAFKERDLNLLREEIINSAEELEEARGR